MGHWHTVQIPGVVGKRLVITQDLAVVHKCDVLVKWELGTFADHRFEFWHAASEWHTDMH